MSLAPTGLPVETETAKRLLSLSERLRIADNSYWQCPLRWPHNIRWLYGWLDRLCRMADVPRGGLQRVRRTGATAVTAIGGDPAAYLGHRTPGLAYRCYVDQTQIGRAVMPPGVQ